MFFYVDIPYYAYHFTVSGHLDFFHILAAFLNNAARNHGVQISLWDLFYSRLLFLSVCVFIWAAVHALCSLSLVVVSSPGGNFSVTEHGFGLVGLVAPWHVGSSQTRGQTHVSCIGRQVLNYWTTGESLSLRPCFQMFGVYIQKQNCWITWYFYVYFFEKLLYCFPQ